MLLLFCACTNIATQPFPVDDEDSYHDLVDEPSIDREDQPGEDPIDSDPSLDPTEVEDTELPPGDLTPSDGQAEDLSDPDQPSDPEDATEDASEPDLPFTLRGSGTWADPFIVDRFPFRDERDTRDSSERQVDFYSCAPETDESGPEFVYRLVLPEDTLILAEIEEDNAAGFDVDLHLLHGPDPDRCVVRHHNRLFDYLRPESDPYLVVDTFVNSSGVEQAGPYSLELSLISVPSGNCALEHTELEVFNHEEPLSLPAVGSVVREAHLVTTAEFPGSWPTSGTDGIAAHYALSQSVTGYEMTRTQSWAPEGEGDCEWGQGSTVRPPVLEEAWYVCMYWRRRPAPGTRMLVMNPLNGRAVVTAAGYETGPGSATRLGGACEEIHHYLDSTHGSRLLMAFLEDQSLPLGPIECE